jgi:hypothetical protein
VKESDQGKVLYFVERDYITDSKILYRQEELYINDQEEVKEGQKLVLAERIKSLEFAYWDIEKGSMEGDTEVSAGDWVKEWDTFGEHMGRLPSVVRIELILEGEEDKEYKFYTEVQLHITKPLEFK